MNIWGGGPPGGAICGGNCALVGISDGTTDGVGGGARGFGVANVADGMGVIVAGVVGIS